MVEFKEWPKIGRLNRDVVITEKLDGTNAAIQIMPVLNPQGRPEEVTVDGNTFEVWAQSRTRIITPEDDNFGFARWVRQNAAILIATLGPGIHFGEWWGCGIQRGYDLSERRFSLFNVAKWETEVPGKQALEVARAKGVAIYAVPILYAGPWTGILGYKNGPETEKPGEWMDLAAQTDWPEAQDQVDAVNAKVNDFMIRFSLADLGDDAMRNALRAMLQVNPRPRFAPNFILEWLKRTGSQAVPGFKKPEGIVVFHKATGQMFKVTVEKDEAHKGERK